MKKFFLILIGFFVGSVTAQAADGKTLPVKHVILSTSGIANFEHEGDITDDAKVLLSVQFDQVDDLLKSLMVFDNSGQLGGISLPGRTPLSQIFRELPFSQHEISSPVALLNALQGAVVTVAGPTQISGRIIRVVPENVTLDDGRQVIKRHRLTLSSENGLKQTVLEDLSAVRFDDAKLRMQVDQALKAVHANAARDSRALTIDLRGKGTRRVSVSYVAETPLWKAAYRLLLPNKDKKTSFMQGWAIIENMTGQDWNDVALTLVSGNPVTFRQPLYQPYYVDRPIMPVEVLGRVLPRPDTGIVGKTLNMEADREMNEHKKAQFPSRRQAQIAAKNERVASFGQTEEIVASEMPASVSTPPVDKGSQFVKTQTTISEEASTQVLFRFPNTFSLAAGHSLMLPFVSRELPVEHLWLYQSETHATHPLAALRVKNDGKTGLPPGIVTLFDENANIGANRFAGDAKLPVLPKGEERLVSYALDTKTLVDKEDTSTTRQGTITISEGVMKATTKHIATTKYTIKAPAEEERVVIVEQPRRHRYKLVRPNPEDVEKTKTHYRIRISAKPGESKTLTVILERVGQQSMRIMDFSYQQLKAYTSATHRLAPHTRERFEKMAEIRLAVDKIDAEIRQLDEDRESIFNDQQRIRENLRAVPNNTDISQRYLTSLNKQEDRLEEIVIYRAELDERRSKQLKKLKDLIADIKV